MSWKLFLSCAALVLLLAGGCAGGARKAEDEPLRERLMNQARAVALLSQENERLRRELEELKAENEALRGKALKGPGAQTTPESAPAEEKRK